VRHRGAAPNQRDESAHHPAVATLFAGDSNPQPAASAAKEPKHPVKKSIAVPTAVIEPGKADADSSMLIPASAATVMLIPQWYRRYTIDVLFRLLFTRSSKEGVQSLLTQFVHATPTYPELPAPPGVPVELSAWCAAELHQGSQQF
jgi:hypothetical protein